MDGWTDNAQPTATHPHEASAARGNLAKNPGFLSLMKDPELSKHLPLLNMILPVYNEQAAGAVSTGAQARYSWPWHSTVLRVR